MKKLGRIANITRDGLVIVKSVLKDPRSLVGTKVYDADYNLLGKVIDVIGRADSPYIVVKPLSREIIDELQENSIVYYRIERTRRRITGKRRRGRGRRGGGRRGVRRK